MKEEKIKVLALLPMELPKENELDNTLEAMQKFVGGLIECITLSDTGSEVTLVCNDEGKLLGLPLNRPLWDGADVLAGPAFRFLNMRMPPLWKTVRSFPMEKAVSGMRRTGVIASSILFWRKSASSQILTTKMVSASRSLPGSSPPIRPTPPAIPTPAFVTAQASTRIS